MDIPHALPQTWKVICESKNEQPAYQQDQQINPTVNGDIQTVSGPVPSCFRDGCKTIIDSAYSFNS
jgi:hypothetical protein